jgi:hypothetical protein
MTIENIVEKWGFSPSDLKSTKNNDMLLSITLEKIP